MESSAPQSYVKFLKWVKYNNGLFEPVSICKSHTPYIKIKPYYYPR